MIKEERLSIMQSGVVAQGNKGKVRRSLSRVLNADGDTPVASSEDEEDPPSAPTGSRIFIQSCIKPSRHSLVTSLPKKANTKLPSLTHLCRLLVTLLDVPGTPGCSLVGGAPRSRLDAPLSAIWHNGFSGETLKTSCPLYAVAP
ncbi:MAG: hypothetical protein A4E62_00288 [Syntrophorhabdus sp. PtaU1.Bin002]|nr:MAG: hypothetical protein A4E58_03227 [Syntrophorhabdus sp. PtaB.Bin006]OPY73795.1 MAG: hypothetical protein A4E62_00288 [Syntrophorhabdus sp. PtaU1.Bin002]